MNAYEDNKQPLLVATIGLALVTYGAIAVSALLVPLVAGSGFTPLLSLLSFVALFLGFRSVQPFASALQEGDQTMPIAGLVGGKGIARTDAPRVRLPKWLNILVVAIGVAFVGFIAWGLVTKPDFAIFISVMVVIMWLAPLLCILLVHQSVKQHLLGNFHST